MPMRDAAQKTDKNVNTQLILALSGHEPRDLQRQRQNSASWHHVCCLILLSRIFCCFCCCCLPHSPRLTGQFQFFFYIFFSLLSLSCCCCCWGRCYLDDPGNCLQLLGLDRNWLHALHEITSSSGRALRVLCPWD